QPPPATENRLMRDLRVGLADLGGGSYEQAIRMVNVLGDAAARSAAGLSTPISADVSASHTLTHSPSMYSCSMSHACCAAGRQTWLLPLLISPLAQRSV